MTTETVNHNQPDASTAFLRAARAGQLDKILSLLNQDIDINVSNANGLNAMHLASKDGHAAVVEALIERGALIDAATRKGNTALHIAALAGQEHVVKLLVQHGAQVNIQSQNGFTPLYMAAQENHDGVVKFLLANGANQSLATEDGFTPLAVAMQQGHEKVVAVLLEADTGRVRLPALHIAAKKDDCKAASLLLENDHNPDVTSKSGFTPLHIAAHYGNEAVAKLLLTKGADVNCTAKHNITPLHVAAKWGKANMVTVLMEHGAQVDARTRDGLTPLHCAARSGHEHVVDMLLDRGAPITGKSKNGLAPLHMAAQGDHVDAARILLYHRAPVDDLTVDYLTALHVAAHCGHVKVAKLLLDRNADANARALNGFTPLHIACKKNRIKVVELLLKYGASISATTESGLTPLHVAAFMGCMNIVIYLLQHEASPDVPTVRGETPLHLAARANQTDIIRILLRNGAAVEARARESQTALHIASRLGNVDIVLLLVQHGAQLDALTADNYNALHIAAKQHNHEVAAVLLEHGAPPNAVTKKGFTPLHLAAKYGNLKVANLLMQQQGAELDPKGKNGVTPLHVAAQYKHHAVASALLEKGADPKAVAKNGHTPLHIAARKNQMETAAALMEKGAVVDAESKAGCTPLHLAAHQGHAEMCSLLIEQGADPSKKAKTGLAALHLAAQEDHVPVAKILVNNNAKVDVCTKGGYTPLHVASHFGQTNMVKYLLETGADVHGKTCHGYTALHHAAQQGHINIVNLLLEHKADANATTNNGQTPFDIAQRLGYVTVMETLKGVSEPSQPNQTKDDKYKPVAPETMYETFMSDSEEEGGEDTMLTDQPYRYLTVDDMKSLGDDSLPIDVTRDERMEPINMKNIMEVSTGSAADGGYVIDELTTAKAVNHLYNTEVMKEGYCYNVETTQPKKKLQWKNFLVSFLVDARGGAMKGCRGSGVRVIVPPLSAQQPTRITCRYVRPQRVNHMPPLMEGEALASRVLELGPVSAKFIGPIILEVPHFASLRGKEREIVILRSDNGTTWREHSVEAADCTVQDILNDTLEIEELPEEAGSAPTRVTRILTHDFPQYFAVISRIRQEVHAIGPEGGMVSSSVVPQVQAVFPQGALTKKIKVGLQAQSIEAELTAKLLGRGVAVSPVVTVEPRRRKFHKAITLSMPAPRAHTQGMINTYTSSAPTLRLLCSISGVFRKRSLEGGTNRAHWEDVTDSTPLTFVNDCVSFTTTVSARYWLMDCRNVSEATKMATELYREAIHVPFMAKFVVYAKRTEQLQAQLRVFCVTDDREDKTLERMERFTQVAKSKDVEVHESKPVYLEFGGNFSPVVKSGEQPKLEFKAFRESRLKLGAMVRGAHADAVARCQFMREPKRPKGEPLQTPICVLNIVLPEEIIPVESVIPITRETITIIDKMPAVIELDDNRITSIGNLLGMDWVPLSYELGISSSVVANIREKQINGAQQAVIMLKLWREQAGPKAHGNALQLALCRIGREDAILPQSSADTERRIQRNIYQERQSSEEVSYKSPDRDYHRKDHLEASILEQDDLNKALDKNEAEQARRYLQDNNKISMDDSTGERDEAKYSPEEKSYKEEYDGSDREISISEESECEEIKKSVAERKIQITRKLSSGKVPASKQKKELKEEMIEIKKQINPEIKKFHVKQSSLTSQSSQESKSSKLSKEPSLKSPEQVEPPKEKVLPKAGPKPMQKHVRNESMIRFSSGDFSDVKVPQQKTEEKVSETKTEKVTSKTEKDIAEESLHKKIDVFESKIVTETVTAVSDNKIKLTQEALKKHTEEYKSTTEYTEKFVKEQISSQKRENLKEKYSGETKEIIEDIGSPELEQDFAAELMKAEETFRASADKTNDKYKENYFEGGQILPHMFTKASRTDSTIVQFSSEDDSEPLKKSIDSETETESQVTTVKQKVNLINEKTKSIARSPSGETKPSKPTIHIEETIEKVGAIKHEVIEAIKRSDQEKLRVDSLEDSLQISSDEEAQIQPTDDESESQQKDQLIKDVKVSTLDSSKKTDSLQKLEGSPHHTSKESSLPSQSNIEKTDSLIDIERDDSYISQSESKVYSKDSRPLRSDSLDEASQFSDMEETQIGITAAKICPKQETIKFLEQESQFSSKELQDKYEKKQEPTTLQKTEEPVISAKARQFIETVPEDDTSVQDCFFSKRIYSDSLEESEQYATDDSRRHSEADSTKSDHSGKDDFRMTKISSDIEEVPDDSDIIDDPHKISDKSSESIITKKEILSKESSQDSLYKKTIKRHSRNESISLTKLSSTEMKEAEATKAEPCQRATEFQMFVTEATDDIQDEHVSSFDREEFSDKISSESSREIEISDKKTSDDKISSESAVTDKASTESADLKLSTDTLQYSPKDPETKETTKPTSTEKIKTEHTSLDGEGFKGSKRTSLSSSFGDNSAELLPRTGKRASDAPSLTDSRDYTFEESEDSIPKHDLEIKAKAILEPIYDKAVKTVRGDSLDDVEAFCLDIEDVETTRLPGILETQYTEEITKSGEKVILKDKFSVHSSPDEIEEKISTETESDQAKVLEIIEPTSEGEIGYIPSFDASKLKQDSLDDADDFLQEKELESDSDAQATKEIVPDVPEYISGFISGAGATIAASIGIELKPEDDEHQKIMEDIEKHLVALKEGHTTDEKVEHTVVSHTIAQSSIEALLTETSSTLVRSIGIDIEKVKEDKPAPERRKSIVEALEECAETATATVGIDLHKAESIDKEIKPQQRRKSVAEAIEESGEIISGVVGVHLPHDVPKTDHEEKHSERRRSVAEAIEESGEIISGAVGVHLPHDVPKTDHEEKHSERRRSVAEAIEESGEIISGVVGVDLHRKDSMDKPLERRKSVAEAIEESGEIVSAAVGVHLPHDIPKKEYVDKPLEKRKSIAEAVEESGEIISGVVGVQLPHDIKTAETTKVAEVLEESGEIMSATVGIELPHHAPAKIESEKRHSIVEALAECGETASATVGIELHHEQIPKNDKETEKILEELKDLNRADRRCSDLLEGMSQTGGSLVKIDTSHVAPGLLPSKFSKTPPPSPIDLIHRETNKESGIPTLLGQRDKGPVSSKPEQRPQQLSPRDETSKEHTLEAQRTDAKKTHASPKQISPAVSPSRHRADISFVNVDEVTIHPKIEAVTPEIQLTAQDLISGVEKRALDTVEEIQKQIKEADESQRAFREETRKQFEDMKRDFEISSIEKFQQMKAEFESADRFSAENLRSEPLTSEYSHRSVSEKVLSERQVFSEKKEMQTSGVESTSKIETESGIIGKEYQYKEKESIAKKGEEKSHELKKAQSIQSAVVSRKDEEISSITKEPDDSLTKKDEKQHAEKGLYSGRQSKSEEKMTAIKDEVDKQSEISYSERNISHEQWGKEYFAEKAEDEANKESGSTEGSPKSRMKAFKQEETYDVDFIKELKVSSSQDPKETTSQTITSSKVEFHHSPLHRPEEHIEEYVWETPVQQQDLEEVIEMKTEDAKIIYEPEPTSKSESKSFSMSDRASPLSSDKDTKTRNDDQDSFRDSMIKSGESVETEYMIKSIDSQDAETLHKSLDSVSAETMQTSEKDELLAEEASSFIADLQRKYDDQKLVKEKSLDDICSSGYDTDLSSAEFLASKLEQDRAEIEFSKTKSSLAELSEVEKTIDEIKQSLEAAQDEIISEKHDGTVKYKQSPSEFEFKLISPDRPEIIPELPESEKSESKFYTSEKTKPISATSSQVEVMQEISIKTESVSDSSRKDKEGKDDTSFKESDSSFKSDENRITLIEKEKLDSSDKSTGLESGPSSLIDNDVDLTSDKEESLISSPEIRLRPTQKHVKSAHMLAVDRRSGSDMEGWSSSGESHYQSFEHADSPHSRPLSSDVENLLTSHSTTEFQSALTTQDLSSRSQKTSKEYYTAVSSLSSRDSMKSLDSESSGHLASMDISDASETLVPTATELKEEMMESGNFSESDMAASYIHIPEETREDISDFIGIDIEKRLREKVSDHSDEGSLDEEPGAHHDDPEIICKMKRSHEMSFQPDLPEQFPQETSDAEMDTHISASESQTFSLSKIETRPSPIIKQIKKTETSASKSLSSSPDKSKSYEVSEKIVEYRTSSVVYKTPEKKPQKPIEGDVVVREKRCYSTQAEPMSTTKTTVTVERKEIDLDSLEGEIISRGTKEYEEIEQSRMSSSYTETGDSPLFDKKSSGPQSLQSLESKQSSSSSLKIQDDHMSTPQTPLSNPSQSSESTDAGREYILDEMYEISEDPELFHSERATDSKSEMSFTTEERTLYEAHKDPDSPVSDEFEMVDKPNEMDDFVVIEEVAKEASEFDTEGKSISISKTTFTKRHDEEVEDYLTQVNKKTAETEYSTSGSLSEEEMLQYEAEQKKIKAAEMAEIEAGKRWIQMQFEGDLRYDYDRQPLEDIKEEEMTDFDASRIGSFASQKESVGSFSSMKNSFGSLSESDILLRKRYMMRSGDPDDVSVSSLQEFENLERALAMENYQTSSSSQDSLNGSLSKKYSGHRKSAQGDDLSTASLKEFEGLETACMEVVKIERSAKQKEAMLFSQDGRQSSAGFLEGERMSYSRGSSESSPPQKSGSPSQKSGSPGVKSGSPGQKSGSPGQKYGSPSQRTALEAIAMKKSIEDQMATDNRDANITHVAVQKRFDNKGAFYVPELSDAAVSGSGVECTEDVCVKKQTYDCKTEGVCSAGIDIPGKKVEESSDSGSFQGSEPGSGRSMTDYGSEFSSSVTSQQSDTESLVTMVEQLPYFEATKSHRISLDLSKKSDDESDMMQREISPQSGRSSSGVLSTTSKHFTDPASGSWSGLDEDMSSSGSFTRTSKKARSTTTEERARREDLMLGSTDSLETSTNATRATYNYETDTPMTGSLTSGGSNTMVSSMETFESMTMTMTDEKTLRVSAEDCFAMDRSGSDHTEYEHQTAQDLPKSPKSKETDDPGQSSTTFYIGDTPIPKGDDDAQQPSKIPIPAKRQSLADVSKQQQE